MPLKYETLVVGPFQENCFLIWDDETLKGVFIDPGDEAERLVRTARSLNLEIEGIYNTHAHLDHAGAVAEVKEMLGIPFALHPEERPLLDHMSQQAQMFGLPPVEAPSVDQELHHGDKLVLAGHEASVLHTPGHSPGGVCFSFDGVVVVGDTLFAGSIGRTDLPGGSYEQLIDSIKKHLLVLDDNTVVLNGHGPSTSIGVEREYNPFLTGRFR
jgi:glyoxylase-like metal-dependent hydrolase (beta-lactamase superfamily II)